MPSWSKFVALSSREKQLLVASLVALPINALALRLISINRWRAILTKLTPVESVGGEANPESQLDSAFQTARMVRIAAARGPYKGNCLHQSLSIWWLLRGQKIESHVRFGARRYDGTFEAHAWVEVEGITLHEGSDINHGFRPFEPVVGGQKAILAICNQHHQR